MLILALVGHFFKSGNNFSHGLKQHVPEQPVKHSKEEA